MAQYTTKQHLADFTEKLLSNDKKIRDELKDELNKKIATADIVNNCTSDSTTTPLAASQGKYLWDTISTLENSKVNKNAILSTVSANPSDEKLLSEKYISGKITEIENKVSVIPSTEPVTKVVGSFWLV